MNEKINFRVFMVETLLVIEPDKPVRVLFETTEKTSVQDMFTGLHCAAKVVFDYAQKRGVARESLAEWADLLKADVLGGYTLDEVLGNGPKDGGEP